jgi:hypothetical protein
MKRKREHPIKNNITMAMALEKALNEGKTYL